MKNILLLALFSVSVFSTGAVASTKDPESDPGYCKRHPQSPYCLNRLFDSVDQDDMALESTPCPARCIGPNLFTYAVIEVCEGDGFGGSCHSVCEREAIYRDHTSCRD